MGIAEADPETQARLAVLRQGLEGFGWKDGQNIRFDYRFADGTSEQVRAQAAELVQTAPDLIVANSAPVLAALRQQTDTIPIVFVQVT